MDEARFLDHVPAANLPLDLIVVLTRYATFEVLEQHLSEKGTGSLS
jgi:hypothetical protein